MGASPDLTIDKRHTVGFDVGANGTYTLVVRNIGTGATSGTITVRDTLPAGLTFVSGTGTGWTVGNAGQVVTATNAGPIAAGDSASFTLTVAVGATAVPSVTNNATVSGGGDVTPSNNRDSDPTAVAGGPDVSVDKRHTAAFGAGQPGTWTIVTTNVGNLPTTGAITVRDTLPTGVTYTNATGAGWSFAYSAPVLTATHTAALAAGDSARFDVNVNVLATASASLLNRATAATPGDTNPANDRDADPTSVAGGLTFALDVRKSASPEQAELGGVVDYSVRVSNTGSGSVDSVRVLDRLPAGFRLQSGSARLDGVAVTDPTGAPGPQLAFPVGTLASGGSRTLTYRVVVGAGAGLGTGINQAYAVAPAPGGELVASAVAEARVRILGGAFDDDGIVVGKVYMDCDCATDGSQGHEELGIPGVRVMLEDGTTALTDVEGKFSFDHVSPRRHVVRVDESTLPAGARLGGHTTREAGQPHSRFVDVQAGELHRADFREVSNDEAVMQQVLARRRQGEVSEPSAEVAGRGRSSSRASWTREWTSAR